MFLRNKPAFMSNLTVSACKGKPRIHCEYFYFQKLFYLRVLRQCVDLFPSTGSRTAYLSSYFDIKDYVTFFEHFEVKV